MSIKPRRLVTMLLALGLLLGLAGGSVVLADTPPVIDGVIFGPGAGGTPDRDTYSADPIYTSYDGPLTAAWLYDYRDGDTYYAALVLDPNYCDTVFGYTSPLNTLDLAYISSVGWKQVPGHTYSLLEVSDMATFLLYCGGATEPSYQWAIDLITGVTAGGPFVAAVFPESVPPPDLQFATSLVWNMSSTTWDYTLGGTRDPSIYWKSPFTNPDSLLPPENLGYRYYDPDTGWEWPVVYEMSFDVAGCTDPILVAPGGQVFTHASPFKSNMPTAVRFAGLAAQVDQPLVLGILALAGLVLVGGVGLIYARKRS
jgi:hypothetical protein